MLKEKLEKLDRPEVKLNESFCQTERNSNRTVLIQTEPIPNKRTRESGAQTDPIGPIPLAYQNQDSRIVDSPPFHYTKVGFFKWSISARGFSGLGLGNDKRFFGSCSRWSLVSRKIKDFSGNGRSRDDQLIISG